MMVRTTQEDSSVMVKNTPVVSSETPGVSRGPPVVRRNLLRPVGYTRADYGTAEVPGVTPAQAAALVETVATESEVEDPTNQPDTTDFGKIGTIPCKHVSQSTPEEWVLDGAEEVAISQYRKDCRLV